MRLDAATIGLALALFALAQVAAIAAVVALPADYFAAPEAPATRARRVGRAVLGTMLVLLGAFLSLPGVVGPGVLVIGAGLMLLDRAWMRRVLGSGVVLRSANALRARFGRAPLRL